jgi:hypothetical protein
MVLGVSLLTGCLKKRNGNSTGCSTSIINVAKQYNFYIGRKNSYFAFQRYSLNRNDEKWPHTRQIKIAGRVT